MARRWPRIGVLMVVVVAVAALAGVQWAGSQSPFRDGAFVVGSDGSRWVVRGDTKYRISFASDDTNALAGLRDGGAVGTISEVPPGATAATQPPTVATVPASGGLTADYQFQGGLGSSVDGAPDLVTLGMTGFAMERVDAPQRTVLTFTEGSGLRLADVSRVMPSDSYTIVILFRFNAVDGFRRLIDFKDGQADTGVYVYSGDLRFYTAETGAGMPIRANSYAQVAITRDRNGEAVGYVEGVRQLLFNDSQGFGVVSAANVLRFFRDDGPREHSAGAVARIRLYDRPLSADEVAALDRLP